MRPSRLVSAVLLVAAPAAATGEYQQTYLRDLNAGGYTSGCVVQLSSGEFTCSVSPSAGSGEPYLTVGNTGGLSAERAITPAEADRLRDRIRTAEAGPLYVAILPQDAVEEAGGDAGEVVRQLHEELGRDGTYAVVVGNSLRAGSTDVEGTGDLAAEALDRHRNEGVASTLVAFVDAVGAEQNPDTARGGGGGGFPWVLAFLVGIPAVLFLALRRRRNDERQAGLAEVRDEVEADLVALADDVRALDAGVERPDADPRAKDAYTRALDRYEEASRAFERARSAEALEPVATALEEGRWEMAVAKAMLEGREPPERTRWRLVALDGIADVANVGSLIRTAHALGMDGMIVGPGCGDPLYRRAIRVSMGHVFRLPLYVTDDLAGALRTLDDHLVEACAATIPRAGTSATTSGAPLGADAFAPPPRWVLVLGNEERGVGEAVLDVLLRQVTTLNLVGGFESRDGFRDASASAQLVTVHVQRVRDARRLRRVRRRRVDGLFRARAVLVGVREIVLRGEVSRRRRR